MKAKAFKGTQVPSLVGKGHSDTLLRREVVALIASRVRRKRGDDESTVRNRISARVDYGIRAGTLRRQPSGYFRLGDVGAWARTAWPDARLDDVPKFPISGSASLNLPALRGMATGYTHPMTLQAAAEDILALRAENAALTAGLAACRARVQVLEEQVRVYRKGYENRKRKPARQAPIS